MKQRFHSALEAILGIATICFALHASALPVITSPPKALTVNAGSTASFSVTATDAGPLSYQWFMGTNQLSETNATLVIENVSTNQAGKYSVKVIAADGEKTTTPVALTVQQGTIVRFALGTNNVDVELFDNDKPQTVQNFLHYIKVGAYTNTFFHRLEPGFVIQGGGFGTADRGTELFTPTNNIWYVYYAAADVDWFGPIANEAQRGPFVRNTAGTLAMARNSDSNGVIYTNSATSQWFFNLADNSTNLDNVSEGFTVFGRVIRGWDVLAAFNSFPTNQIVDLSKTFPTNGGTYFPTLPYQTNGGNSPRNADLFYLNISLLTKVVGALDKSAPSITVAYPPAVLRLTNGSLTFRGTAKDNAGTPMMDLTMNYYSDDGIFNGGNSIGVFAGTSNWSIDVANLVPHTYLAAFRIWDASGNHRDYQSLVYIRAPLKVGVSGQGTVSPNLDGQYCDVWPVPSPAKPTLYTMKASAKPGWLFYNWTDAGNAVCSLSANLTFVVTNNMALTANFLPNYLTNVGRRYDGLFCQSNTPTPGRAGYITLSPKASGIYSGYLLLGSQRANLSGQFDAAGHSRVTSALSGSTNKVTVSLTMDLTNNTGTISGTVSGAGWSSDISAYRSVTKLAATNVPAPGKYVLRLPADPAQTNQPAGDGYVTVTVAATGVLTVAGALPDGSTFSESVTVSKDGKWPLFASLNGGKGLLYGWETFSTNCAGQLQWVRPNVANTYYSNGFTATIDSEGLPYVTPVRTNACQIVFSGGALNTPVTNLLSASTGLLTVSGKPANQLKLSMIAAGTFSGTFTNAASTSLSFKGAFENPQQGGFGYFVTPSGQSGEVQVTPVSQ